MHQVFHLDELVRNVAYCADATTRGSASLLALACCCKSLEGMSLYYVVAVLVFKVQG